MMTKHDFAVSEARAISINKNHEHPKVHPSSIIEAGARIHPSVEVGPFCLIESGVEIGEGCKLLSHVVIKGDTKIGKNNVFYQFGTIGEEPPDKKYGGESTKLIIGDNNVFREAVTVHIGTVQDEAMTLIGDNNLLLAYVHIAHDCQVGSNNVFANGTALAGHVKVGNHVNFGGFAKVSQYCIIGDYVFICADSAISKDVPAFLKIAPTPARPAGLNSIGMTRAGINQETQSLIKQAYRVLYLQKKTVHEALKELETLNVEGNTYLNAFILTVKNAARGIIR